MEPASLDLLPTALFSPSKAAAQRAQAQEWQQVDSWLSAKYQGRSVPQFERNEDTLRALLALSAANEKADEERDLLWNVQREALGELRGERDGDASFIAIVENGLDAKGKESLEVLAEVATRLDCPDTEMYTIAETLSARTQTSQILAQQLLRLTHLQKTLENELVALRAQLQELRSPAFQAPLQLQRQTLEWTRNTKQLRAKLTEYSDRLSSLEANRSSPAGGDVYDLAEKEGQISALEDRIQTSKSKEKAYKGLPKDKDDAIAEYKKLEGEVQSLQQKLNRLFEGLVERR